MNEHDIVRSLLLRIGHGLPASAPLARAVLEWAKPHAGWLLAREPARELDWDRLVTTVREAAPTDDAPAWALVLAKDLAGLLGLPPFDSALLAVMLACDRLPRAEELALIAAEHGQDLPCLLGEVAGADRADAAHAVRQSAVLKLGLVGFALNRRGKVVVSIQWALQRVVDRGPLEIDALVEALVGPRQPAALALDDFPTVADADFLVRLLIGAVGRRAAGINILIHGPPGTGKTELARTLAAAAGVPLHAVGEADEDGEEPERWERVHALQIAQRLLAGRGGAVLLFDEMEDLIGDARPSGGDWFAKREGSKIFVNRMLEANPIPVIWTTNAIGNVDKALLRRMSFVLKLDLPSRSAALRMLGRIAADEGVTPAPAFDRLIETAPETATVLRVAARAARLADESDGGVRPAAALARALRGGELPFDDADPIALDLFETDLAIGPLLDRITEGEATDVSLLLTGPPGTGKTAFAHHFARALDRPLVVKRASDLLSRWVGGTEAQIAAAFGEARHRGGVLLFDEADSLLFDRSTARTSWEVGQVNELLTWLDRHPLPVIAATNHPGVLDPATLRRFVFKLALRPLGPSRAAMAFERFFGMAAPAELTALANLTPGDFAVVARQLRHAPARDALDIVDRLRSEAEVKPGLQARIGF